MLSVTGLVLAALIASISLVFIYRKSIAWGNLRDCAVIAMLCILGLGILSNINQRKLWIPISIGTFFIIGIFMLVGGSSDSENGIGLALIGIGIILFKMRKIK